MKILISDDRKCGYIHEKDYHWTKNGEVLMFGQFQTENNRKTNEWSMLGIESRKFTTHIFVRDLPLTKQFYKEMIVDSVEKAMKTSIGNDGVYIVSFGDWGFNFNINDMVDELIQKASVFSDGDKLVCVGRILEKFKENDANITPVP